jgi:hypothetical protein
MMNRQERRAAASYTRREARNRPERLTMVDREQWPQRGEAEAKTRIAVFVSKRFLVQIFTAPDLVVGGETIGVFRMSVNRVTLSKGGRFDGDITWNEMNQIKRDVGFSQRYALEVFPTDYDLVDVANMRHLWVLDRPLPLGWFTKPLAGE